MLEIQKYLAKKSLTQLQSEFGIKVKSHQKYPNLVALAYDQIKSPLHRSIVQECRGIVIDTTDNNRVVSMAYKKFFNYGEFHGDDLDLNSTRLYEKLDGTMCNLYHYNGEWMVSTTGTPDASGECTLWGNSFASLFWHVFNELDYELPKNTNYCYIFELCTPYNQVVVLHDKSRLVLHGVRNLADGCGGYELAPESANEILGLNYELVKIYDLPKTWSAITQFVRDQEGVISLLSQLSNYGKVTPYNFYSPSQDFFVHLNKPEGSGLCFRISYSHVQNFTVDQMVKKLNEVLVDFIRKETEIEGFL